MRIAWYCTGHPDCEYNRIIVRDSGGTYGHDDGWDSVALGTHVSSGSPHPDCKNNGVYSASLDLSDEAE